MAKSYKVLKTSPVQHTPRHVKYNNLQELEDTVQARRRLVKSRIRPPMPNPVVVAIARPLRAWNKIFTKTFGGQQNAR